MSTVPPIAAWPAAPLSGKVVLVTGGANGIGRGIAQAVLGAGGRVLIGDLDVEAGEACLAEWQRSGEAAFQRLDITDEASVRDFIAVALRRFSRIDGLVNNAGIAGPHGTQLQDMDWDEWQRRLSSLHGAFLCSKHALPALTASAAGAIINIASTRAWQSEAHSEAYAAAKGGLVAFTHALAISAGPTVRVNSISPGWIGTTAWQAPRGDTHRSTPPSTRHSTRSAGSAAPRTSARWRCTCCRRCPASAPARTSSSTAA